MMKYYYMPTIKSVFKKMDNKKYWQDVDKLELFFSH